MVKACVQAVNNRALGVEYSVGYPLVFSQAMFSGFGFADKLHSALGVFERVSNERFNRLVSQITDMAGKLTTVSTNIVTKTTGFIKKGWL